MVADIVIVLAAMVIFTGILIALSLLISCLTRVKCCCGDGSVDVINYYDELDEVT
jgi:hypothetical protein